MHARQYVKRVLPPVLVDLIQGRPLFSEAAFTWQGIYSHFRDVPAKNGNYDDQQQVEKHLNWTREALDQIQANKKPHLWHEALGLVAAMIGADSGIVHVLDFGGGVGSGFVQLIATLNKKIAIEYHVVDLENMCIAGRKLFAHDSRIKFYSSLPALSETMDIVYVNTALQYIEDYAGLLHGITIHRPSHILLARLAAGQIPTYATKQMNLKNKVLPYWFLNVDEVIELLTKDGYKLHYSGLTDENYDQSNFPETHRIGRMCNLLFARNP